VKVLIALLSCWKHRERRDAQRDTWIRDLVYIPRGVEYRFFLGRNSGMEWIRDDETALDCPDDYVSLSQKTKAVMRWIDERGYDFVFKADDDTYIVPARLLASGFEAFDYSGSLEENGPNSHCPFEVIPWAQGGAGYWTSARAVKILAEHMIDLKHAEDAATGRTLAKFDIRGVHDPRYQPQITRREREFPGTTAITFHKVAPGEMRELQLKIPIH